MQLHELFEGVAERVEEGCDLLAERVVTLGVATREPRASRRPLPLSASTISMRWTAWNTSAPEGAGISTGARRVELFKDDQESYRSDRVLHLSL